MTVLIRLLTLCATVALAAGCAQPAATAESATRLVRVALDQMKTKPYSAESNLLLTDEERGRRLVLSERETREALAAMRGLAVDFEPAGATPPAEFAVRWSDVPLAVRYAGEHVEMAIARQRGRITDDEMTFVLTTIDGRPAHLRVTRTHDERVYEATATVGRFGDDTERARLLLKALDRNLKALGRKRGFE